jgi:hypothetical protein
MPAMKMVMRVLVVWVMLVMVLFQGLATAGVLPCAPSMPAHAMPPGQHDHAAMLAAQQANTLGAHASHANHDTPAGHDDASTAHHCGGASPCCVGAAIAPSLPHALSGPRLTGKLVPLQAAAPAAVDLATPERPPRPHLA